MFSIMYPSAYDAFSCFSGLSLAFLFYSSTSRPSISLPHRLFYMPRFKTTFNGYSVGSWARSGCVEDVIFGIFSTVCCYRSGSVRLWKIDWPLQPHRILGSSATADFTSLRCVEMSQLNAFMPLACLSSMPIQQTEKTTASCDNQRRPLSLVMFLSLGSWQLVVSEKSLLLTLLMDCMTVPGARWAGCGGEAQCRRESHCRSYCKRSFTGLCEHSAMVDGQVLSCFV